MDIIQQFGILFIVIVVVSLLVKLIKQPMIVGYVVSGLLFAFMFAGDNALSTQMLFFSQIGIMFLLFLIGIEFDFSSLKYVGKDILIATVYQSIIFFLLGLGVTFFFPFTWMERVHLAILLMFSSTLLVAKLLEDKRETSALHGKIIIATLIIQDLFAIIAIAILGAVQSKSIVSLIMTPLSSVLLLLFAFFVAKYLLDFLFRFTSKSTELLFLISVSICFFFGQIASLIGYSTTIGAFVGGVVLGNTIYKTEVYGNLKPLIIFFNMLFFVGLGFQMQFSFSPYILLTIGIFALISFFIKPIVIFITLRNRGYDIRTCFLSGLYLAQISEFGIIIFVGSVSAGLIGSSLNSLAIILIIVTMLISSYFIKYDKKIFNFFVEDLEKLDKFFTLNKNEEEKKDIEIDAQIVFFGYYEFGKELMENLQQSSKKIIVIENDPEHIEMLKRDKIKYVFGTPYSPEFFEHVKFKNPELVISNKLDVTQNKMIIKELKKLYPNVIVIVTARRISDSLDLYKYNADYVIYPSYINEQHISVLLQEYTVDINKMIAKKVTDLSKFQKKKEEEIETTHSLFQDVDVFLKDMQSRMKNKQIIMGHGKINSNTFNDQEVKEKMSANELLGSIIEHDKENKKEENSKKTPDK